MTLTLSTVLLFACEIALIYFFSVAAYNIFFHPLLKLPGPKIYTASYFPTAIARIRGSSAHNVLKFHEKYGPIVRVAPNEISYIDSRAVKDIYGQGTCTKGPMKKDILFYGVDPSGVEGIFRAQDERNHARQRRVFSHAFSEKALKEQEVILKKHVDKLVAVLTRQFAFQQDAAVQDPRIDILRMYSFAMFDITINALYETFKYLAFANVLKRYPFFNIIFQVLLPATLKEARKCHFQNSVERCERRMAAKSMKPDIWSFVIRAKEERMSSHRETMQEDGIKRLELDLSLIQIKNISREEMYSNSSILMTGGTETMSALLSSLTYFLCKDKQKLQKLVKEIRAFDDPNDLTMANLSGLKYLSACIHESLRLYPPVPEGLPRIVPDGGARICDDIIPGGTCVYYTHLAAHRCSYNFANPLKFEPERWTAEADKCYAKDDKNAWQPFSYGPRNCIGQNLAIHEARLIISALLWHFDISLSNEDEVWTSQRIFVQWDKKPLYLRIRPVMQPNK